jgi:hypothetical protein
MCPEWTRDGWRSERDSNSRCGLNSKLSTLAHKVR